MIFESLTLFNYCQYKGQNTINFEPKDDRYCVTLIGGLNGAGKTAMLEALQVAFYGRNSKMAQDSRLSYQDFLEERICRQVPKSAGTSLELNFRVLENGEYRHYSVTRTWSKKPNGRLKESLDVSVDGKPDDVISENWDEHAEWLIPVRLAPLFFFDGEKIEDLADPDRSREAVKTAVEALLGLDIISRLQNDLITLERRKISSSPERSEDLDKIIAETEAELHATRELLRQQQQDRAKIENDFDKMDKDLKSAEHELKQNGGEALENQKETEKEHESQTKLLEAKEVELRDIASGCLPLALVIKDLRSLNERAEYQVKSQNSAILRDFVADHDKRILKYVKSLSESSSALNKKLQAYLNETFDNEFGSLPENVDDYELPEGIRDKLNVLLAKIRDDDAKARTLLGEHDKLRMRVEKAEKQLSMIPEEEAVADSIQKRADVKAEMKMCERLYNALTENIGKTNNMIQDLERRLYRQYEKQLHTLKDQDEAVRVVEYSKRAGKTLETFKSQLLEKHANKLSGLIQDSFTHLTHKTGLTTSIEIDSKTYELLLKDKNGEPLPTNRLSAGERQLLAVSILWGLGRAAGRPLPVIVDTPLGRLDGDHRANICSKYFPFASHQVILLSTDEEIVGERYEEVKPYLAHAYVLDFDDESSKSIIREGYFEDMEVTA